MRKYITVVCFGLLFFNCNQFKNDKKNKEVIEVQFINETFHVIIDDFIRKTDIYAVNKFDSILIQLYTSENNSDTLMSLHNFPPIHKHNFIFGTNYKGFKLYFYSSDNLKEKFYKLVDTSYVNRNLTLFDLADTEMFDVTYQEIFVIDNDSIYPLNIPLEIR